MHDYMKALYHRFDSPTERIELLEEETDSLNVKKLLAEDGLSCRFVQALGEAKHVFTHRIWNMRLLHYELEALPSETLMKQKNASLLTKEELLQLPVPSAMKAAFEAAIGLLEQR